ncbi:unnamed protein product [Rhizophagus irregularis]|nr:unnamed protein product [Rhizophagus irregularis]CAB5366336.1 unnamed protein product [Rhizophagus irregularis]
MNFIPKNKGTSNGGCEENGAAKNDENTNQNYGMQNKTKKENMLKQNNIEQDTEMEYLEDEELCMRGINISNHRPKGAKVLKYYTGTIRSTIKMDQSIIDYINTER